MNEKQKIKAAWEHAMLANTDEQTVKETHPDALLLGDSQKGDFGFCAVKDGQIIIAFRGSDDKADWKSNLNERINFFEYHTGFWDSVHRYINQISDFINLHQTNHEVLFCGHSRGGALALLAGYCVGKWLSSKIYVFGCPKVCTKKSALFSFVKDGDLNITSVVNGLDIVPRAPFEFPWSKDYVRVGKQIVIGKRLSFRNKLKMMWCAVAKDGKWKWFADHHPDAYAKSLEKY